MFSKIPLCRITGTDIMTHNYNQRCPNCERLSCTCNENETRHQPHTFTDQAGNKITIESYTHNGTLFYNLTTSGDIFIEVNTPNSFLNIINHSRHDSTTVTLFDTYKSTSNKNRKSITTHELSRHRSEEVKE